MSSSRTKLELIDDPVKRRPTTGDKSEPAAPVGLEAAPAAAQTTGTQTVAAGRVPHAKGYGDEARKAVFGRLPRSLTRRLERALVELREDTDDLTQEQLLAALLHRYVDPADPDRMNALAQTVESYRRQL